MTVPSSTNHYMNNTTQFSMMQEKEPQEPRKRKATLSLGTTYYRESKRQRTDSSKGLPQLKNLVDPASLLRNRHEPKLAMTIPPMKRKGVRIRSRVLRAPRKKPRRFRDSSKWVQPRRLWPFLLSSLEFPTSKLHDNSNKNRLILRSDRRIVKYRQVHFPETPLELVHITHVRSFVNWLASHNAVESYYTSTVELTTMQFIYILECKLAMKFGRDLYERESAIIRAVLVSESAVEELFYQLSAEEKEFYQVLGAAISQLVKDEKKKKVRRAARKLQKLNFNTTHNNPVVETSNNIKPSAIATRENSITSTMTNPARGAAAATIASRNQAATAANTKTGTPKPSAGIPPSANTATPGNRPGQSLYFTVPSLEPEPSEPVVVPTATPSAATSKDSTAPLYNTGRWSEEEHTQFLNSLKLNGVDVNMIATKVKTLKMYEVTWKTIAEKIETRTPQQTYSHGQSYFNKLATTKENQEEEK